MGIRIAPAGCKSNVIGTIVTPLPTRRSRSFWTTLNELFINALDYALNPYSGASTHRRTMDAY